MILLLMNPVRASDYEIPSDSPYGWYLISTYHGRAINCRPVPNGFVDFNGVEWHFLSGDLSFKPVFKGKIVNKREAWEIENKLPPSEYYRFQVNKEGPLANISPGSGSIEGKGFYFTPVDLASRCFPPYLFSAQGESWKLLRKSCRDENFIACIADKFSKKFPFDILFNLPPTQITCPKVNFFGSEFDLCFIYEAMRLIKYPIAAALVMKIFLYL
jgi:hypothetical protein